MKENKFEYTYRALDDEEVDQMLDDMIDSVELDGQNPPDWRS